MCPASSKAVGRKVVLSIYLVLTLSIIGLACAAYYSIIASNNTELVHTQNVLDTAANRPTLKLVWLVTGCSSGIGNALIRAILDRGDLAIATGRNLDSLNDLKALGAEVLELDVTAASDQQLLKMQEAINFFGRVDVLVQNAGFGQYSPVEELGDQLLQDIYATNVLGVVRLVKAIMPHWRERNFGRHVVISSLDAVGGMAGNGAYSSSKAAVTRLIESFNDEVAPLGYVKNLIIEPGLFRTSFHSKLRFPTNSSHYQWLAEEAKSGVYEVLRKQPGNPTKLAELIIDVVRKEGLVANKEEILNLPLGKDAFYEIKENAEQTLRMLKEWESVIMSTDFDDF